MAAYFPIILVLVTIASGLIWLFDVLFLKPKRVAKVAELEQKEALPEETKERLLRESMLVENAHAIFPVIAFVTVLRSFLYEPFQIPSGSMMPTLLVGDFILVEKYSYGVRDPIWRHKFLETGNPERGDVMVFKYPEDPKVDYIKRVVGVPGDKIIYRNKQLWVQPACAAEATTCPEATLVPRFEVNRGEFAQNGVPLIRYQEQLGEISNDILINPSRPEMQEYFYREADLAVGEWLVPDNQYFVLGDNRDNSRDSRFWGFVPEENLVGKAVAIWISFEFERSNDSWLPTWVPSDVRFDRIGAIH